MKKVLMICCVGWVACGRPVNDAAKEFMPGTYVKFSESDYSKAWDTLRISAYEADQGTYVIQQHVGFQRIVAAKLQPKEYKSSTSMTVFDESTHQLQDMKTGKFYTFFPDKGTVLAGSAEYAKMN